jgi:hypothetical protein
VKKVIPACRTEIRQTSSFVGSCSLRLHNLEGKDYSIGKWITQQLCLKGWEPFAVTSYIPHESTYTTTYAYDKTYAEQGEFEVLHFRFEVA